MLNQSASEVLDTEAVSGVRFVEAPEELNAIYEKNAQAVIWQRKPAKTFQDWVDNLDPEVLPSTRMILHFQDARKVMAELCNSSGLSDCLERTQLIDDVSFLAKLFANLMVTPYLKLRLSVVQNNSCRKFHIDAVTARLICTYRGQGTQYGNSVKGEDPDPIFNVSQGCPIVIRGTEWTDSGNVKDKFLHRSPPIEETGETRLLLVLDPAEKPDSK